jgi:hypothetical protein
MQLKTLKKHGLKMSSNLIETCPKCGYHSAERKELAALPGGIKPSLLLDSSPSPQLLLSESNIIVYANKCAARVLRIKNVEGSKEEKFQDRDEEQSPEDPVDDQKENEEEFEKPIPTGLEGHSIDQLNIDLAEEDTRRWVSLVQVFENIKLNLNKREAKNKGTNAAQQADMYGEGPKYASYDYYGDQERSHKGHGAHADTIIRDTAPIVIEREDGQCVLATMYAALIDPFSTGYSYTAVSFVPGVGKDDVTITTQMTVEDNQTRRNRKRDKLRNKFIHHHYQNSLPGMEGSLPEQLIGKSGETMMRRVARIKDLILDEMEYCFIALSPDGDIVITNAATKAVLGQETLEASIGWVAWRVLPVH